METRDDIKMEFHVVAINETETEIVAETSTGSTSIIGDVGNIIAGVAGKSIIEATAVAIPE